jgi:protein-disulfide isomerase
MPPVPKPKAPRKGPNRSLVIAIAAAGLVAAALIVGSILLTRDGGNDGVGTTTGTVDAGVSLFAGIPQKGTVLGNPKATVRMLQFEDLQCPVCKKYSDDAFPAIVKEYVKPGHVKIDFRGLAFLGPDSEKALRIVVAAGLQNKLWDVVELLYTEQGAENSGWVTDAKIDEILAQVPGLDAAKVKVDAKSAAVTKEIAAVQADATARKVGGTPWFFIAIGLKQPYEIQPQSLTPSAFRPALDDALKG